MSHAGDTLSAADQARLRAAVDLVGRTGATSFEVGYLHDDVPVELAGWWAHAQYRGRRITVDDQPGPIDAAEALAVRLMTGAMCAHCKQPVLMDDLPIAGPNGCRWWRSGAAWVRGCDPTNPRSRAWGRA